MSLNTLIKKYGGKWVALNPKNQTVVSSGLKAKNVYEKAQKEGIKIPTLFKVPQKYTPYIG